MKIEIFRAGQSLGKFEEETVGEGIKSGRLRVTDEYFFEGMNSRRTLSDFAVPETCVTDAQVDAGSFIRIHKDPVKSRRESKRNDVILLSALMIALLFGFGFIVFKDVSEKKERRKQAERERLQKILPDPHFFLRPDNNSGVSRKPLRSNKESLSKTFQLFLDASRKE